MKLCWAIKLLVESLQSLGVFLSFSLFPLSSSSFFFFLRQLCLRGSLTSSCWVLYPGWIPCLGWLINPMCVCVAGLNINLSGHPLSVIPTPSVIFCETKCWMQCFCAVYLSLHITWRKPVCRCVCAELSAGWKGEFRRWKRLNASHLSKPMLGGPWIYFKCVSLALCRKEQSILSPVNCWNLLLLQVKRESRDRATLSDLYLNNIIPRFAQISEDSGRLFKKVTHTGYGFTHTGCPTGIWLNLLLRSHQWNWSSVLISCFEAFVFTCRGRAKGATDITNPQLRPDKLNPHHFLSGPSISPSVFCLGWFIDWQLVGWSSAQERFCLLRSLPCLAERKKKE